MNSKKLGLTTTHALVRVDEGFKKGACMTLNSVIDNQGGKWEVGRKPNTEHFLPSGNYVLKVFFLNCLQVLLNTMSTLKVSDILTLELIPYGEQPPDRGHPSTAFHNPLDPVP